MSERNAAHPFPFPKELEIMLEIAKYPDGARGNVLRESFSGAHEQIRGLIERGIVEKHKVAIGGVGTFTLNRLTKRGEELMRFVDQGDGE